MANQIQGYYRYPTIHNNTVVFVSEDDLWSVEASGGLAQRLTANLGEVTNPFFSPDGKWIAFVGREEGHSEVYIMPSVGGVAKRLTYLGSDLIVVGWRESEIVFATNYAQPFVRAFELYTVDINGNTLRKLPFGLARNISFGKKGIVIGRNTGDPARWKRYRGGTAGEIWIDEKGSGNFHKLVDLKGNLANPMWIGERVYFISDHEGVGNIYSCLPNGEDVRKHTNHEEFYARNASTDGHRIVYHAGADIYIFDPENGKNFKVQVVYRSPVIQRSRKFVDAEKYLEDYSLSQEGKSLAIVTRGKSFTFYNWEGPVIRQNFDNGVRHRLSRWLSDQKRIVLVSDEGGEDHLEIHWVDGTKEPERLVGLDIGRPYEMKVSPQKDEVILSNHKNELIWVNLKKRKVKKIDRNEYDLIKGFDWSPDGRWVAYSMNVSRLLSVIKIYDTQSGEIQKVTKPVLRDVAPVFDPQGRYLYFLSHRIFNPIYDNMQFDFGFPKGMKPYLITLKKDLKSPFISQPENQEKSSEKEKDEKKEKKELKVEIDFDGIAERLIPFPVDEGIYTSIAATKNKIFYTLYPIEGVKDINWLAKEAPAKAILKVFDLEKREESSFMDGITSFKLSGDGEYLVIRVGNRLRVVKTKINPKDLPKEDKPSRKTGWIALSRVKVLVDPLNEWRQMFREAWRLQRDYYWIENMAGIDWKGVFDKYYPLVDRVASRSEFSDLLWEVQGELGTSHAYELGGDYRPKPEYKIGFLGADFSYDSKRDAYVITHIVNGDVWDDRYAPPLKQPGVNVKEGMYLLAINGQRLSKTLSPEKALVNMIDQEVQLTVAEGPNTTRIVTVKTVPREFPLRYREWVERNREYVHDLTKGKVGYVHIPDMMADGYAEFHRYFLAELEHEGLIVDVRFNRGGAISQLLLGKLARKRIGYDLTRWMGPQPYPTEAPYGPVIALTNEYAGSDGDIFSHSFKLMKLGKLFGRRTWGGVIGIWPRNWLVDGTITTQPEFSFWFKDVGWGVENYGTDPDVEVDITPQDYAEGKDPQLDKAIEEVLKEIRETPPLKPDFSNIPKKG